ncbi:MAG: hypothetical protein V7K67_16585 [Nostoc sp.]|uniref:hypothetical protein n=1 Tax=Nostoc sp. TaxID=1180 RepID=UPI002FF7E1F8
MAIIDEFSHFLEAISMAYREISKGVSLAADHAKYLAWLQQDTGARQTAYKAIAKAHKDKVIHVPGFIIPFAANIASKVYLPREILKADQGSASNAVLATAVATALLNRIYPAVPGFTGGGYELTSAKKFKFAKISVKQTTAVATSKSASRITGREYQKNTTSSVTGHFGQILAGETEATALAAIIASTELAGIITAPGNSYRYVPEGG